ncbi:MaoC family dehydratase N-terminal domain-containing protein [Amycolatopsis endophytica]|uniref:3-methylfumaryl-CoA hydratase n=1 Tax=Amycolatopsis endophytica TaxID=860233 RepID=A0A853B9G8_9PSEU|nr:MaoC family dehydratase N-terminal domain-containing protein [Amycolatopsis endophytica]NYI91414.1 3-methylfumaryl-CoA hydratase [Amycolatopsis endophytica]
MSHPGPSGEVVQRTELLLPGPAKALGALLDVPVPDLDRGEGLPLLWHWFYLLDHPAQADLGPDGHPVRHCVPAPPGPDRRRMWAGGQVRARGALRCGERATRRTRVRSVQEKQGRSGPLTFVAVEHLIEQGGHVVVEERQDIVYRPASSANPTAPEGAPIVPAADGDWALDVSPTLLFRFSALTYNAHRIHYDRDYARDVEGYPGLLTHGPLQALAMAEAARAAGCGGDQVLDYRLVSPLFDHQGLIARAEEGSGETATAVRDIHGRRTATGTLRSEGR